MIAEEFPIRIVKSKAAKSERKEMVMCPFRKKMVNVVICKRCEYNRIVLAQSVKCLYNQINQ